MSTWVRTCAVPIDLHPAWSVTAVQSSLTTTLGFTERAPAMKPARYRWEAGALLTPKPPTRLCTALPTFMLSIRPASTPTRYPASCSLNTRSVTFGKSAGWPWSSVAMASTSANRNDGCRRATCPIAPAMPAERATVRSARPVAHRSRLAAYTAATGDSTTSDTAWLAAMPSWADWLRVSLPGPALVTRQTEGCRWAATAEGAGALAQPDSSTTRKATSGRLMVLATQNPSRVCTCLNRMAPAYCFLYGRPTAAGAIERPMAPATTTMVST